MGLAYQSALDTLKVPHCFLFSVMIAEHCSFDLFSSFSSALIGGSADHVWNFKGAYAPAELGFLFSLAPDIDAFFADVGLLSI